MEIIQESHTLEWQTSTGVAETHPRPASSFPRVYISGRRQWCAPAEPPHPIPSSTPHFSPQQGLMLIQCPLAANLRHTHESSGTWGPSAWLQENQEEASLKQISSGKEVYCTRHPSRGCNVWQRVSQPQVTSNSYNTWCVGCLHLMGLCLLSCWQAETFHEDLNESLGDWIFLKIYICFLLQQFSSVSV
ncbi:uncharacterized protein LOC121352519 isoform X2 [Pyrgilauda ruficollis]|uniref:uncharacterized protein LOC121352519 isoform X2 n=1 Tax=Pyrgilauda ruficollis TaxID=221976 RepID=UPI001B887080|nr:uncharacterized protein LOC121352519 isoform X2 [Pyrgilauda ruficollis]